MPQKSSSNSSQIFRVVKYARDGTTLEVIGPMTDQVRAQRIFVSQMRALKRLVVANGDSRVNYSWELEASPLSWKPFR